MENARHDTKYGHNDESSKIKTTEIRGAQGCIPSKEESYCIFHNNEITDRIWLASK